MPKLCPCPMPRNHTTIEKEREEKAKKVWHIASFVFH